MKGFLTEGEVVEKLRDRLGAGSQKLLATQLEISEQYLCDILKGRRRPSDSVLEELNLEAVEQLYRVKRA